jgi:glycosyltransferase involved in cell wall biosynthesis
VTVAAPVPPDSRPHILYLIDTLWGMAGAEKILLEITQMLPRERYRCTVATFHLGPRRSFLKEFSCPIREFGLGRVFGPKAFHSLFGLGRFLRTERVDILHTFFKGADLLGGLVASINHCPVLISSRRDMGILCSFRHRAAYRLLHSLFDQVQTVSEAVRGQTIRADHLSPNRVVTIPNGIDLHRVDRVREVTGFRETLGIHPAAPLVACIGHLRRVKGIDVALRAAAEVRRTFPDAVFLFAGAIHEPAYNTGLQDLVRTLDLGRNVHFLGRVENDRVAALLKESAVFCLLSRSEGMSNALLEAMACGVPCVATSVGGNPEVVVDGKSGFLVASEDASSAAARIVELLDNPERAQRMGEFGRRVVERRFTAERMIDSIVEQYDLLLASRRREKAGRLPKTST